MPNLCAVVGCGSRGNRDLNSFFGIPAIPSRGSSHFVKLKTERRLKWIAALKRTDLTDKKLKYAKICDKHFITGRPAELQDINHPDWVPSVLMGYKTKNNLASSIDRYNRKKPRGDPDGDLKNSGQPESPSSKKRRTAHNPNQASPALPDLIPPQPVTGFGETIVASNPFDDTIPVTTLAPPPPVMPGMASHMPPGPPMHSKPVPMSSGKVYPPDQPMVFNPQNPNAPPIYPCGICHKEVHDNDQAILCESGCNFWFHRVCTGLTEAAFHLLTAEVYAEWVCDKCLASKSIPLVKFKP